MVTRTLTSPLAGRQAELAELSATLQDALSGRGRLLFLTGEPGIGKTRLAEELAREAEERGAMVAWGAAWDGGGAPPYFPWTEVLRSLRPLLPEPSAALSRDLGPLWDAVEADGGGAVSQEASEALHFRRADALRAALSLAAGKQPLVIVLDDVHAADLATLRALHFVARSLRSLPILVICTKRDQDPALSQEAGAQLARIVREGTSLPLSRLSPDGVRELLGGHDPLPQKWLSQVVEASSGNPFFVHEFLRLLRTGATPDELPDGIRLLVAERTNRLGDTSRAVLSAGAILGREVPLGPLGAMTGLDRPALLDALTSPRQAGIVQLTSDGRVSFCHPLFRECLYDALTPTDRARLHGRAALALANDVERTTWLEESIARHELLALPEGNLLEAVERGRRAASTCRRALAFDRAVSLLELCARGLRDCGEKCHAEVALDLDLDLAEALVFVGAGERGRTLCLAVANRAREDGDALRLARAALSYGAEIRPGVNDPVQVELLEDARRRLPEAEVDLSARVMARLAATRSDPDPDEPIALAQRAISLARETGNDETLLQALHMGGAALVCYAPAEARRDTARELASLATEKQELVLAQRAYQRLAIDAAELLDLEEMDAALAAEEKLAGMLGHARFRWRNALLRSMRSSMAGDWPNAEAAVLSARALVSELDDPAAERVLDIHCAGLAVGRMRGTPAAAEALISPAMSAGPIGQLMAALLRSAIHARLGEPEQARGHFARIWPLPAAALFSIPAVQLAADAAARTENEEACAVLLPVLERIQSPASSWAAQGYLWSGPVGVSLGAAALALGQTERAVSLLDEAARTVRHLGLWPCVVDTETWLAEALLRRGQASDRARASELLESARRRAEELGMDAAERRIERILASSPSRPPMREPGELTLALSKEGEFWRLEGHGQVVLLKHSRALDMLKLLLDHPHRDFHVLELGAEPGEGEIIDRADGGEIIDPEAKRAYQARLRALSDEIGEAERWHDQGRTQRLQAERDFLEEELRRSLGTGGRLRRTNHAAEKARVNVKKRLQGVIDRLQGERPALAAHLQKSIKTGTYVSYQPVLHAVTAS